MRLPPHTCLVCGKPLRFNDDPAQYFGHARANAVRELAPEVDRYLASLRLPVDAVPTTHLKLVHDDITFIRLAGRLGPDLNIRRLAGGLQGRVAFDFAFVTAVAEGGASQLAAMLAAASADADVYLCRVPPQVVAAIAEVPLPPKVAFATLWLPFECLSCGERLPQRVEAHRYVEQLARGAPEHRRCDVCGAEAKAVALKAGLALVQQRAVSHAPFATFEELEPRALSQLLVKASASLAPGQTPGHTPGQTPGDAPAAGSAPAGSSTAHPESGPQLELLRRIGQGGMAEVFLARQHGLKGFEKYVVLKKVLPQHAGSPRFVEMLFAEARSSARLMHPNIVQVHDVGELHGVPYITMEYVRGPDLRRLMQLLSKARRTLPIEHALRIVSEIAAALHYAHRYVDPTGVARPVYHRDVSPHNILISLDGSIKLSDFGIAKVAGEGEHTRDGILKGKIAYLPPETARGDPVDHRGDIFSLGVVLYELLTGTAPFRRERDATTMYAILMTPPPDMLQLNPAIGQELAAVVLKALEKSPANRYQTAGQFRQAIEEVMKRMHLRSAPDQVAEFFQGQLGDSIDEFRTPGGVGVRSPSAATVAAEPPPLPASASGDVSGRTLEVDDAYVMVDMDEAVTEPPNAAVAAGPALSMSPPPMPSAQRASSEQQQAPVRESARAPAPSIEVSPVVSKPRPWLPAAIAASVVALAGGTWLAIDAFGPVAVENLGPDERVYLSGLRVDAREISVSKRGDLLLAISKDGILRRFGRVRRARTIDAESLPEHHAGPKETANLWVSSDPKGCAVSVDGAHAPSSTPLSMKIKAGEEMLVEVMCPGLPRRAQWILAAPGQEVQVSARMFDDEP